MDGSAFDEQVVRLDKQIADLANQFVLVRMTDMRGVDLDVFTFDYDLVWAGLFMDADQRVLGRFGGRSPESAERYLSLKGLRYAMEQALLSYRSLPRKPIAIQTLLPRTVEQYPAIGRYRKETCIHCHQAYDFVREAEVAAGTWQQESLWVYPPPENLGFRVAAEQGNRVEAVSLASPAARADLQPGDVLQSLDGLRVASFADIQYALHRAVGRGSLPLTWSRGSRTYEGKIALPEGWRRTDLSWRASTRRIGPNPCVQGEDLSATEKQALGLETKQLAFRQGSFPVPAARQAGIRANDIVLGLDGKHLEMSAGQFGVYLRLNYHVGDRVAFDIFRAGKHLNVSLTLPASVAY
jgi:hypothetical protein